MATTTLHAAEWKDKKKYLWPLGAAILLIPVLGVYLRESTGHGLWLWMPFAFLYLIIPTMDKLFGEDSENPPEDAIAKLAADRYYRWAMYLAVPVYLAVWTFMVWYAATSTFVWWEWLAVMVSTGVAVGIAVNLAHELGHQTSKVERFLAKLVLAPGAYGHFFVEHPRGHHVRVATPEDPASSRFGETFYEFYPRCMAGSFKSGWNLEKQRLNKQGLSVWNWRNDNLQAWAMTAVIWSAMVLWLGWMTLPFMLITAIYGGSLLEVVNYLEHYGLCRQKDENGKYERCQPHHSWNSNHIVTNVFLYHLQRHSDHHANPTRSYQTLRNFENVPSLPSGYAAMILVAYVPPLWFKLMNPKVVEYLGGDMSKANIKPGIREKVIAQYSGYPQTAQAA